MTWPFSKFKICCTSENKLNEWKYLRNKKANILPWVWHLPFLEHNVYYLYNYCQFLLGQPSLWRFFYDSIREAGTAISFIWLCACFHSNFWTKWPLTFSMCMGHDHSSPGIEGQGQRLKTQWGWTWVKEILVEVGPSITNTRLKIHPMSFLLPQWQDKVIQGALSASVWKQTASYTTTTTKYR